MTWYSSSNSVEGAIMGTGSPVKLLSKGKGKGKVLESRPARSKSKTKTNERWITKVSKTNNEAFLELYNKSLEEKGSIKKLSDEKLETYLEMLNDIDRTNEVGLLNIFDALIKEKNLRVTRINNLKKGRETQQHKREEAKAEAAAKKAQEEEARILNEYSADRKLRTNALNQEYGVSSVEEILSLPTLKLIDYYHRLNSIDIDTRSQLAEKLGSSYKSIEYDWTSYDISNNLIDRGNSYIQKWLPNAEYLKSLTSENYDELSTLRPFLKEGEIENKLRGNLEDAYNRILGIKSYKTRLTELQNLRNYINSHSLLQHIAGDLCYYAETPTPEAFTLESLLDKITRELVKPSTLKEELNDKMSALVDKISSWRPPKIKINLSKKQQKKVDKKAATSTNEEVPTSETPASESTSTKHWYLEPLNHWYVPLLSKNWWDVRSPQYWMWNGIPWAGRVANAGIYNSNLSEEDTPLSVGDLVGIQRGLPLQVLAPTWYEYLIGNFLSNRDWKKIATTDVDLTKIKTSKEPDKIKVKKVSNPLDPELYHYESADGEWIDPENFNNNTYVEVDN